MTVHSGFNGEVGLQRSAITSYSNVPTTVVPDSSRFQVSILKGRICKSSLRIRTKSNRIVRCNLHGHAREIWESLTS